MKWILAVILLVSWASPCVADEREEDRKALRAIAKVFEDTVRQRDLSRFQAVLDPAFVGVMVTNEVVNRESIKRFWDWAWGLIGPKGTWTTEVTPEPATFYGDLAVAHGTAKDLILTERGGEWRFTWNWTAVFRKTGNEWKLITGHGSMDPPGGRGSRRIATWGSCSRRRSTWGAGGSPSSPASKSSAAQPRASPTSSPA